MLGLRIVEETFTFVRIHVALPAQKRKKTLTCSSLFCQLWVLISLKIYFVNSGWCAVAAPGTKASVSVWGHVSGWLRGHEDIREHDTVCLSFSVLQLQSCDFLGRAVYVHISQLHCDCCNETRHCGICAKSSHNHLLPLGEEHLQPGCRFLTCVGHPPDYVITEDIRLHSP